MILGIDPGLEGAFAILGTDDVILEAMPRNDDGLDAWELNELLRAYADHVTHAYLELAGMRFTEARQVTATTFRNFGIVEGMLACLRIPVTIVPPQTWSREFDHGVTEKDPAKRYALIKLARRKIAGRLYPGINLMKTERSKVPHSGIVDALLIAHWGMQQRMKGK